MGVRLASLAQDQRTVKIAIGDEQLTVVYNLKKFTPALEDQLHAFDEQNRKAAGLRALLCDAVLNWDLLDDADAPIPITPAALSGVPVEVLGLVLNGMMQDVRPNPTSAAASGATSQPTGA